MKIINFGLNIETGKIKYIDENFKKLVKKFEPLKESPFIVEFCDPSQVERAEGVVFDKEKILDLIVMDLEKIENRLPRVEEEAEKVLLIKCQKILEEEKLLCDNEFNEAEETILRTLQLVTHKACVGAISADDINALIAAVVEKAGVVIFFTAGKKEVHTWSVDRGEPILEAAGKIHSDLKRGFIKGEVVNCKDLDSFYNMAEAKSRGFMQLVDRGYLMQTNDVIEIRFNV